MNIIKSFTEFLLEGARLNSDKTGAIISKKANDDDFLPNSKGGVVRKMWKYNLFYALNMSTQMKNEISRLSKVMADSKKSKNTTSFTKAEDEKRELVNTNSEFMKLLKAGKFQLDSDIEATHEKYYDTKYGKINLSALFNFIKPSIGTNPKTGNLLNTVKYVVFAESAEPCSRIIAEAIKVGTGAKIIELKKREYKVPSDIIKIDDLNSEDFNYEDLEELRQQLKIAFKAGKHKDSNADDEKKRSSTGMLIDIVKKMKENNAFKITTADNHVRKFLNTKYNYSEDFTKIVQECFRKINKSGMIIVDDNVMSGTDMSEIFKVCERVYLDTVHADSIIIDACEDKTEKTRLLNMYALSRQNVFAFVLYNMDKSKTTKTGEIKWNTKN